MHPCKSVAHPCVSCETTVKSGRTWLSAAPATWATRPPDPPTQAELQSVADKLDELITVLKRP